MIKETASPESSIVESTIIELEMISKMFNDRISPRLSIAIPPRNVMTSSLVVRFFRRKRNLNLRRLNGSPRYNAPIRALASKPDNRTANSGYDDVTENRPDATKRVTIMGYRMTFIIDREA